MPYVRCLEAGWLGSRGFRQVREGGTLDASPPEPASPPPTSCPWSLLPLQKLCLQGAPEIVRCTSHMPTSAPHSQVVLSLFCHVACFLFGGHGQMLVTSPNLPLVSTCWPWTSPLVIKNTTIPLLI